MILAQTTVPVPVDSPWSALVFLVGCGLVVGFAMYIVVWGTGAAWRQFLEQD